MASKVKVEALNEARFAISPLTKTIYMYLPKKGKPNEADEKVDRTAAMLLTVYQYLQETGQTLEEAIEPYKQYLI